MKVLFLNVIILSIIFILFKTIVYSILLTLSASVVLASGKTFPYTGTHQQLHRLASATKFKLPASIPNSITTRTAGKSLQQ